MSEFEDGLDPDLVEMPSHPPLGSLAGLGLGNGDDQDQDPFSSPYSAHDAAFDSAPVPRRRTASSMSSRRESHRQSLAFELAAAMDPEQNSTASLLSELGIEEEDEEQLEGEELEGVGEGDAIQAAMARLEGGSATGLPKSPAPNGGVETPRGAKSSRSSVLGGSSPMAMSTAYTSPPSGCASSLLDLGMEEEEEDFDAGTAMLRGGISSTDGFLSHLKLSNSAEAADSEVQAERMIGEVVKAMADQAKARESHVRELREIDTFLSTVDRRILAEIEPIPELETDSELMGGRNGLVGEATLANGADGVDDDSPTTPLAHRFGHRLDHNPLGASSDDDDSEASSPTTPTSPSPGAPVILGTVPSLSASTASPPNLLPALMQLRMLTSDLVASLATVSEHTQVSRAASAEAGRKLKSVKGMAVQWSKDQEVLEASTRGIERWEREEGVGRGEGSKGRYKERMGAATLAAEQLLEEALHRASALLTPNP